MQSHEGGLDQVVDCGALDEIRYVMGEMPQVREIKLTHTTAADAGGKRTLEVPPGGVGMPAVNSSGPGPGYAAQPHMTRKSSH